MLQKTEPVTLLDGDDQRAQSYALEVDEISDEMGQLTISMGEDETEVNESNNHLENLEELAAGLEAVCAALNANPHGADPATLRLAKIAQNGFAKRAGLGYDDYSVEAVGANVTRKDATRLALESANESIKKAYNEVVRVMKIMWDAFLRFIENIFQFFFATKARLQRLKERAQKLQSSGAQSSIAQLPLPSRLQYAFQIKNKPMDPVALVSDGKFTTAIEEFAVAHIKYSGKVMTEVADWISTSFQRRDGSVDIPNKLLGLLHAEALIKNGFKGETESSKGRFSSHLDIPGNRVLTVSTPVVMNQMEGFTSFYKSMTGLSVSVRPYEIPGKPQESIQQLSLDDVIAICEQGMRAITAAENYQREVKRLGSERARVMRALSIVFEAGAVSVQLAPSTRSMIGAAFSRYTRNALAAGGVWINTMKRVVLNAADVAFLATKAYEKDAKEGAGTNPFYTATIVEPLALSHQVAA